MNEINGVSVISKDVMFPAWVQLLSIILFITLLVCLILNHRARFSGGKRQAKVYLIVVVVALLVEAGVFYSVFNFGEQVGVYYEYTVNVNRDEVDWGEFHSQYGIVSSTGDTFKVVLKDPEFES